jgi:hypothetical protein
MREIDLQTQGGHDVPQRKQRYLRRILNSCCPHAADMYYSPSQTQRRERQQRLRSGSSRKETSLNATNTEFGAGLRRRDPEKGETGYDENRI